MVKLNLLCKLSELIQTALMKEQQSNGPKIGYTVVSVDDFIIEKYQRKNSLRILTVQKLITFFILNGNKA